MKLRFSFLSRWIESKDLLRCATCSAAIRRLKLKNCGFPERTVLSTLSSRSLANGAALGFADLD